MKISQLLRHPLKQVQLQFLRPHKQISQLPNNENAPHGAFFYSPSSCFGQPLHPSIGEAPQSWSWFIVLIEAVLF